MHRTAVFVAVAGLLAAILALAAALLARFQGQEMDLWLSMGTALVVGTFLAFLIMGPRRDAAPEPATEGFAVVSQEEAPPVVAHAEVERPEDAEPGRADPPAGGEPSEGQGPPEPGERARPAETESAEDGPEGSASRPRDDQP